MDKLKEKEAELLKKKSKFEIDLANVKHELGKVKIEQSDASKFNKQFIKFSTEYCETRYMYVTYIEEAISDGWIFCGPTFIEHIIKISSEYIYSTYSSKLVTINDIKDIEIITKEDFINKINNAHKFITRQWT